MPVAQGRSSHDCSLQQRLLQDTRSSSSPSLWGFGGSFIAFMPWNVSEAKGSDALGLVSMWLQWHSLWGLVPSVFTATSLDQVRPTYGTHQLWLFTILTKEKHLSTPEFFKRHSLLHLLLWSLFSWHSQERHHLPKSSNILSCTWLWHEIGV